MDTKLKKFSRSKLTKTVAFFLALLFFTLAVYNSFALFISAFKDSEKGDIIYSYFQKGDYLAIHGARFKDALTEYCEAAVKTKLVYKSGSEKDYENYKAALADKNELLLEKIKADIRKNVSGESGTALFSTTLSYLDGKKITLKRLGNHTCYIEDGVKLCQDGSGNNKYVTDSNGNIYSSYTDYLDRILYEEDEEDYDEYTEERITSPVTATNSHKQISDESVTSAVANNYDNDSSVFTKTSVPGNIKKKASKPENVIEICSLYDINTRETYDGYYEFFIDESKISTSDISDSDFSDYKTETVKSYADFKQKAVYYREEFKKFSHASIIIADEKSGKIIFSNTENFDTANSSLEDAENLIVNAPFGFSYRLASGNHSSVSSKSLNGKGTALGYVSTVCTTLNNDFFFLSGKYVIYVSTDSFFTDNDLVSSTVGSPEPFEDVLAESKTAQNEVRAALFRIVLFFVFFIILTVYLVIVAGRRPEDDEVHMAPADGIFTLLRTCIDLGAIAGIVTGAAFCYDNAAENIISLRDAVTYYRQPVTFWHYFIIVLCSVSACAFLLDWILYLARHIKNRSLFKNFLLGRIIVSIKRKVNSHPKTEKIYKDVLNDVLKKITLFVLLPNIVIGLPCLISVIDYNPSIGGIFFGILLVIYDIGALGYAVYYAYNVRKLFNALGEIRNGNYNVQIDMSKMPGSIWRAATDIMHLGEGLSIAVDNAVKEEKMKAELITNVSHDLKTPLTSIINYTDLLSRCEIADETAQSYIAVLKEKSERLKKLIEDLVEASKASSGAINVELIKMSLNELAMQIEGEYEDEFEAKGLELIVEEGSKELFVLADGKLSHRVLDNLMSNVKKYAMPHTRVYMTLQKETNGASVTIRNISEGRLNISPEELKARFVRGDSSRTSEGNGLGLSIADNLAALQGGRLDIEIIGDLFSVKVTFRSAE